MDIITGILSLILAVFCGIIVYFISVSSMKEKTYDEVKAEQKKKTEEYLAPGRSAKDKAKDKKVKKAVKKSKENHKTVSSEKVDALKESDIDENHVASVRSPAQQITKDRVQDEQKENIIESSQRLKKQFDNLINFPTGTLNTAVEHQQKISKPPQKPADKPVKMLKQEEPPIHLKSDKKTKVQSNNIQENQEKLKVSDKVTEVKLKNADKVADNQFQQQIVKDVSKTNAKLLSSSASSGNALSLAKIPRKKRNDVSTLHQINGDRETVDAGVLTTLVHKSEMTGTEIQALIECLLNKQLGAANVHSADWTEGRQDPVMRLKKQLAEKERAVAEEQEAAAALQSKLRDLRNELNAARTTARQHEEAGARLQQAVEEKQALVQQIQQLQRKLADEHRLLCQTQADQEQQLQHELLAQRQQLEIHITRLTEQHQEEVRTELEHLMGKLQYETTRLQTEVTTLQEQLSGKRAEAEQLAAMVQALQADNARLTAQISSACVEAQQLRDENETLSAQVVMERPATEGMEHNGDNNTRDNNGTDKIIDADVLIEKLREDLESHVKELSRCKGELSQRESLMSELKRDVDKAHANTESVRKESKYTIREQESSIKALREEKECAQKLARSLREEVEKSEMEMARLRNQLEGRDGLVEALKSELNTHKTRIADQAVTIEALRADTQSDDLRKAVDAHQQDTADKEAKITALTSQVAMYRADVTRLQGALDASKEATDRFNKEWQQLEQKHSTVCQELETLKSEKNEESNESLDDLLEQNGQLQSLVAHYKAIIGDTEAMLNRLQSHVEREETRWRQEMRALQAQLTAQQDASDSP